MNRLDRLREYAKSLRTGPPGETKAQAQERHALREEAERRLHEHDHVAMKYEVAEDPRVVEFRRRRLGNKLAEQEVRERLRREVPEQVEHVSPAQLALSRTDDQRTREKAWAETDGPQEGWLGT